MSEHEKYNVDEKINEFRKGAENREYTFHRTKNLTVGVQLFKKGENYADNEGNYPVHPFDEIYYILKGDGNLKIGDKSYEVEEGKAYYIPQNVQHGFSDNAGDIEFLYIFGGLDKVYYPKAALSKIIEGASALGHKITRLVTRLPPQLKDKDDRNKKMP